MSVLPQNVFWFDAVQVVLLILEGSAIIWLFKRSIEQGEKIATLWTRTTNHYSHRFEKLAKMLGIEEWDDEE